MYEPENILFLHTAEWSSTGLSFVHSFSLSPKPPSHAVFIREIDADGVLMFSIKCRDLFGLTPYAVIGDTIQ